MKKVFAVVAVVVMTIGFVGCNPEDTTAEDQLYEQATDKDDTPSGGDKGGN